jgi:DNA-binding transcriptional MerR regulator
VTQELLKMSQLAERSGVSPGTIKHYLREGLLGDGDEVVRTSRNMAYYPPEFVERIQEIKRLQEDRFLPLKVIKELLAEADRERVSRAEVAKRHDLPRKMLERLAELGVLTPDARGYDADDVKIIEAMAAFRAGGYDEALGFTVYETLRYKEALEPLVQKEIAAMQDHLADVAPERAAQIIAAGSEPLRELIGAMHSKLLIAELRRRAA